MRYRNASEIFPDKLLKEIQKYSAGEYHKECGNPQQTPGGKIHTGIGTGVWAFPRYNPQDFIQVAEI